MECNKEEAIKAKEMAERKMQSKDFMGARKLALKAQQLYSDLENISQMLTVCDVHCSSENKLFGSEVDWYAILQIEQTADDALIKKQYRKFALLLHPDKNKFSGAEAAFKLIGEAQRVLLDKVKRSQHDMKRRGFMRNPAPKPPPHQTNRNTYAWKPPGVQNNFPNTATTGVNPHLQQQQQARPGFSNGQHTFWTVCTHCRIRYQYYKNLMNLPLRCPTCSKTFIATEISSQAAPIPQQKDIPGQGAQNAGPQGTFGNAPFTMGFQGNFACRNAAPEFFPKTGSTSVFGGGSNTKGKEDGDVGKGSKFEEKPPPKEAKPSGKMNRKRKSEEEEEESSESFDTSSSDSEDDVVIQEDGFPTGQNSSFTEGYYPRRSTRQKQNVTYNEDKSDDDDVFVIPSKRAKGSGSSNDIKVESKEVKAGFAETLKEEKMKEKQSGTDPLANGNDKAEECKINGKKVASDNSESNSRKKFVQNPELLDYPDPDFNDFDKDRSEECFEADQIWAVYDSDYGMPRFYARITKVHFPGFKLRITWLEPDPDEEDEIDWMNADLPVACGKFIHGKSENTEDLLMFSHLASWEKGRSRRTYLIYPRKGETWALYKNWDIKWKSNPDDHREHKFEFVEVLSDYSEENGTKVVPLGKVKGFVSVFQPLTNMGISQIFPKELFRFSHRVPSFRIFGEELEDVPEGSLELDPACLPKDFEEFAHAEDVKAHPGSTSAKNGEDLDEKTARKRDVSKRENGSASEMNGPHKNSAATKRKFVIEEDHVDDIKDTIHKVNERQAKGRSSDCTTEDPSCPSPASSVEDYQVPESEFYNFDSDKLPVKFQPDQIWALYSEEDCLPKYYARIKKIESSPDFKLQVAWLESFSLPRGVIQWVNDDIPVSCGIFKVGTSEPEGFEIASFSHQISPEVTVKNKYYIHPRKGEVWALYKNWNPKWRCSGLKNCKFDVVEVLEENDMEIKLLVLEKVEGYNSVFKAQRKEESAVSIVIPLQELLRFSHQVPAFRLTEEKNGSLRGSWEIDPASMPSSFYV